LPKKFPRPKGINWELPRIEGEPIVKCEICGGEGIADEIEIFHRGCRLSEAFPSAYEAKDGMLFFDPQKMREDLEKLGKGEPEQDSSVAARHA
jgi:hypothetical protein